MEVANAFNDRGNHHRGYGQYDGSVNDDLFTIDHKGLHYRWITQILDSQKLDVNKGMKEASSSGIVLTEVIKFITPMVYVLQRGAVFKKKQSRVLQQFHNDSQNVHTGVVNRQLK